MQNYYGMHVRQTKLDILAMCTCTHRHTLNKTPRRVLKPGLFGINQIERDIWDFLIIYF